MKLVVSLRKRVFEWIMSAFVVGLGVMIKLYVAKEQWLVKAKNINNPGFLPNIVAVGLIIIGALMALECLKVKWDEKVSINLGSFIVVAIWFVYGLVLKYTGFILGSIIALAVTLLVWGEKKPLKICLISVITPIVVYLIMGVLMQVRFPTGFLKII